MATMTRLERESIQRKLAKECRTGIHPPNRQFWKQGDYATPDELVCGRCYAVLARRTHSRGKDQTG